MSDAAATHALIREVFAELLPELAASGKSTPRWAPATEPPATDSSNGVAVPTMPAPPVAAVHRPASWTDATPTSSGHLPPAAASGQRESGRQRVEQIVLESDADLDAFVHRLLGLYENPRDREALRSGRLRFALHRRDAPGAAAQAMRIEKRAVTERIVDEAAAAGLRLVLGPGAVLTPMGRDRAKKLRVEIEKETRC